MVIDLQQFLVLREQLPLVDVRSEGEYQQGHIQKAINIPILNDAERVVVGTTYKRQGQAEAIKTGFRLVGPRLIDIIETTQQTGKEIIVHCWRGGMRSGNYCQFVGMAGVKTHQLIGGYKVYRQYAVESFKSPFQMVVITGNTGSGKTELLRELKRKGEQVLDLEHLASHRGSVFGGFNMPGQPTTEQFQNNLFEVIRRFDLSKRIWLEDESIAIGRIFLPLELWKTMGKSPLIEILVNKDVRVQRLTEEYKNIEPVRFIEAMQGITKKLGGQHFNAARDLVLQNDFSAAIEIILNYYDKAYANGLQKKSERIKLQLEWDGMSAVSFADHLVSRVDQMIS